MLPFQRHLQTVRLSSLLGQGQKTVGPVSQLFYFSGSCGTSNNPHRCSKRVGDVDPGGVANLSWARWFICKDTPKLKPLSDVCSAPYGGSDRIKSNCCSFHYQAPVAQTSDSAMQRINHSSGNRLLYPLNRDLSSR